MIASAFFTALYAVLVVIFFSLLMCVVAFAMGLVGLLIGFIVHLWQNHKARKKCRGE